jgi:predicted PurR-regulated permease PerM
MISIMHRPPAWRDSADAWFKLLGAIVFGYLILGEVASLLHQYADVAIILVGGVLLAYLVLPAVTWLRRRLPLWSALSVVYVAGLLAIAGVAYVLVPAASEQLISLVHNLPSIQHAVQAFIANPNNALVRHLPTFMQAWVQTLPSQIAAEFERNAISYSSSLVNALGTLTFLGALTIAIPVVSIYLLAEAPLIQEFVLCRVPVEHRPVVLRLVKEIDSVLGGFVRGQLIVAAVVGTLATTALLVLHIPYALLIGAWAGLADVIPYVGPFAGALPAGIVAIVDKGWGSVIGVIVAFVAINQLEGHFLGPRIVSRTVHISSLGVIFGLLIGAQLFGFLGLIVAVPLAGLVRIALISIFPRQQPMGKEPPG